MKNKEYKSSITCFRGKSYTYNNIANKLPIILEPYLILGYKIIRGNISFFYNYFKYALYHEE